jgi:uncharacterized protein YndB with AHSA1/START domain
MVPRRALVVLMVALAFAALRVRAEDAAEAKDRAVCETVIPASQAACWKAYTTGEGLEAWCVPHADVDLRLGGLMRTTYDPDGKLGDEKTIENEIICFDPERMIALKVKKAPAGFPFPEAIKSMWTVLYFEDAGEGKTRVVCRSFGFGSSEESQKMRAFFKAGNAQTLAELKKHLTEKH